MIDSNEKFKRFLLIFVVIDVWILRGIIDCFDRMNWCFFFMRVHNLGYKECLDLIHNRCFLIIKPISLMY